MIVGERERHLACGALLAVHIQLYHGKCEKYAEAMLLGWAVLRIPSQWCFLDKQGLKGLQYVEGVWQQRTREYASRPGQ